MRWAMYNPSRIIKNVSGKEIARYVSGVLDFTWDGRQATFYRPQGEITEYSAAVVGERSACICFDIFEAYAGNFLIEHREVVERIVNSLLPDRLVKCEGVPRTATVSITDNGYRVFHVKSTYPEHKMIRGIIEEHTYMKSAKVSLDGEWQSVYILPDMTPVSSRIENGRTVFETGDILGYRAFLLK